MNKIKVKVEVKVKPTEDIEKVKSSVQNIFGDMEFKIEQTYSGHILKAQTFGDESLLNMYELLDKERILAAARRVFFSGLTNKSVVFNLNKQVAYAGHISFSQEISESPLGPIKVEVFSDNPRRIIEILSPKPKKRNRSPRSK